MGGRPFQFLSIHKAQQRLEVLNRRRDELHSYGATMLRQFRDRFPDAPAYLTHYSDRTFNDYRWRRSSAKRWRGEGEPASVNRTFSLLGEDGQLLLQWLPADVREVWLRYERERLELNRELALASYERLRLRDHVQRLATWRDLARNCADDSE